MTIGFIGTGNMGGALMKALAPHYPLCAYNRGRDKLLRVCEATGAVPMDSIGAVAAASNLLVLAVKPNVIPTVLEQLAPVVQPETIVVSVAVSLPLSLYEKPLGAGQKIVRAMPNTPASVGAGMTALCFSDACTEVDRTLVREVFSAAGLAILSSKNCTKL